MSKDKPKPWTPKWDGQDWIVDFRPNGSGHRRIRRGLKIHDPRGGKLARDTARQIWDAERARLEARHRIGGTPFFEAAATYVRSGGEARFLPPILRHFGPAVLVEDIGPLEITGAGLALYPDATEGTRKRQVRTPIRAVINFHRGESPQRGVDQPRTRWLTPDEAEALIAACDPLTLQKVAFLLGSGCRTSEIWPLRSQDYNRPTRQFWIDTPKNGHPRWVTLPERAVALMGELPQFGILFLTPKGKPYVQRSGGGGQMQAAFNRARDKAGLSDDVTPHVLRHTWATWFYAQTRDFGDLMDLGGWQKADMANRYRKLAPADLGERLAGLGWDFRRPATQWAPNRNEVGYFRNRKI